MSFSWEGIAATAGGDPESVDIDFSARERERLEVLADLLIPEADGMPAASAVGVAYGQLDAVLRSRPDLAEPLRAAVKRSVAGDINEWMAVLAAEDPDAHHALSTTVLAAYYLSPEVREQLGYPGQQPMQVTIGFPEYVTEGLLDSMLENGPRYRDVAD